MIVNWGCRHVFCSVSLFLDESRLPFPFLLGFALMERDLRSTTIVEVFYKLIVYSLKKILVEVGSRVYS